MQTKKSYLTVMIFCAFMVLYFQQFRDGEERVDDHTVDKNQNDSIMLKVEMPYIKKITNTGIFLDMFLWRGMFLRSLWEGTNYKAQRRLHRRLYNVLYQQEVNQFSGNCFHMVCMVSKNNFFEIKISQRHHCSGTLPP